MVVSAVVERELASGQTLVGTVMPARRSTIGSAVDGRVVAFSARRGQAVKKGETLAQLRTTQLEISLRAARAELSSRASMLAELRNGATPEQLTQSQGTVDAAAAMMKSTKAKYDRAKTLYSRKAMNEDQYQDAIAAYDRARATHSSAVAKDAELRKGARAEQIAAMSANVEFQSEQVKLLQEQIARHTIVAPFDGYVASESSEVGQWVGRGDAIAEVIELAEVEVEVFVLEKYLTNVRTGLNVQVAVPSVPSEFFEGRIERIVPQADLRSRSFPVRIRIRNAVDKFGPVLKAGMLARAQMPLGKRGLTKLLDKDAVVLGNRDPMVYVLKKAVAARGESTVTAVPVQLGVMDGKLIQVIGNVRPGDQVVIRGNERLKTGESVRVTEIRGPKAAVSKDGRLQKPAEKGS